MPSRRGCRLRSHGIRRIKGEAGAFIQRPSSPSEMSQRLVLNVRFASIKTKSCQLMSWESCSYLSS